MSTAVVTTPTAEFPRKLALLLSIRFGSSAALTSWTIGGSRPYPCTSGTRRGIITSIRPTRTKTGWCIIAMRGPRHAGGRHSAKEM